MRPRFTAEFFLFVLAGLAHFALGRHFHAVDLRFFPSSSFWPYSIVGISALFVFTGLTLVFKWRSITIYLSKIVAFVFLLSSIDFLGGDPRAFLQLLPSVLVLFARSKVIDKAVQDDRWGSGGAG